MDFQSQKDDGKAYALVYWERGMAFSKKWVAFLSFFGS